MQYAKKKPVAIAVLAVFALLLTSFAVFAAEDVNADNNIAKATTDAAGNNGSKTFIGSQYAVTSTKALEEKVKAPVTNYTVVDGKDNKVTFETVPQHVISIGAGINATVVKIGQLDKIVVADSYTATSASYNFEIFKELRERYANKQIAASGNVYSSGRAALISDMVKAADDGKFDRTRDVVILTGSDTYLNPIVSTLKGYGFTKILCWNDITDYADIANFVDTVSVAITGENSVDAEKMRGLSAIIKNQLGNAQKAEAFYVTYSSSTWKVGNTGSLANSMILAAGGNSITVNPDVSSTTYEANITSLVEAHPKAVIFIDNTIAGSADVLNNFNSLIRGANVKVVPLNPLWNNYSPVSVDGVKAMAVAMYPDIFNSGTVVPGEKTLIVEGTADVVLTDDVVENAKDSYDAVSVVLDKITIRLPVAAIEKMDSVAITIGATLTSKTDETMADRLDVKLATDKVSIIDVNVSNAVTTSDLGKVTVVVPYTKETGSSDVAVYFIGADKVEKLVTTYDSEKETVTFETGHFSQFAIVEVAEDEKDFPVIIVVAIVIVIALIAVGAFVLRKKQ